MKQKSKPIRLLSFILTFILLIGSISVPKNLYADESDDVSGILEKDVILMQDGNIVPEGGSIVMDKNFQLKVSINVPVKKSDPAPLKYVKHGDKAKIKIGKGIDIKDINNSFELKDDREKIKIGTAKYTKDGDTLFLNISFDGSKDFFENADKLQFSISDTFMIDKQVIPAYTEVYILGKKYKTVPGEGYISIEKTGKADYNDATVEWTVNIKKNSYKDEAELKDFLFYDDLKTVGDYVKGSFKVGENAVPEDSIEWNDISKELKYKFKDTDKTPLTIKFKTQIGAEFYSTPTEYQTAVKNNQKLTLTKENTAKILKNDKEYAQDNSAVTIDRMWMKKSAKGSTAEYYKENNDYYIDWVIEFNSERKSLKNVKIEDKLPQDYYNSGTKLEFVSAILEKEVLKDGKYEKESKNITPENNNSIYNVGNIDGKIKLAIKSKILNYTDNLETGPSKRFSNIGVITWGYEGQLKLNDQKAVTIGNPLIKKRAVKKDGNYAGQEITWNIKVEGDKNIRITDKTYVYDMMIFDPDANLENIRKGNYQIRKNDETPVISLDGVNIGTTEGKQSLLPKDAQGNIQMNWIKFQKYTDKFEVKSPAGQNIEHKTYKIYVDNADNGENYHVYAGDLLEVSNLNQDSMNEFTFTTVITDHRILLNALQQGTSGLKFNKNFNISYMFTDKKFVKSAEDWPLYKARMLEKQALPAINADVIKSNYNDIDKINDNIFDNNTNTPIDNRKNSFNTKTNSAIFRLSINAAGIDNTAGNNVIGDIVVEDMLPEGWELTEIVAGKNYLLYEGERFVSYTNEDNKDATVKAVKYTDVDSSDFQDKLITDFSDVNKPKFTFKKITKPYVILLEAKPKDANKFYKEIRNIATVNIRKSFLSDDQVIDTTNPKFYDKFISDESNIENGYLEWTIQYDPNNYLTKDEIVIADKLGSGLEIRREPYTNDLQFDGKNYKIVEGKIVNKIESGKPVKAFEQTALHTEKEYLEKYIKYDRDSRQLSFTIPDKNKAYQFMYITDVYGETGDAVNNKAFIQGEGDVDSVDKRYVIPNRAIDINKSIVAELNIKKVDGNDKPLKGVEFELKSVDGLYVASKTTDENGEIIFERLKFGKYKLKEIKTLDGYIPDTKEYNVTIIKLKDNYEIDIETDGNTDIRKDKNKITVINRQIVPSTTSATLFVNKRVEGKWADKNDIFKFKVEFKYKDGTPFDGMFDYYLNGITGKIGNNGEFELKDGDNITIKEIPTEINYILTETDYKDYIPYEKVKSGTITTKPQLHRVEFVNRTTTHGQLKIEKEVSGSVDDKSKKFKFRFNIGNDPDKNYTYEYKGSDGEIIKGYIKAKDTIDLSDGEYIIIKGIKFNTTYEVSEDVDNNYTTTVNGKDGREEKGTVVTEEGDIVKFVNTRIVTPPGPNTPDDPTPPKPTEPTPNTPPDRPDRPEKPDKPDRPEKPNLPTPSIPSYPIDDTPNPNDPNSPDNIVVSDEDGVPLGTYTKRENPDGSIEYVDEDGVPLGGSKLVKTGNEFPQGTLMITSILSLFGLIILRRYRKNDR